MFANWFVYYLMQCEICLSETSAPINIQICAQKGRELCEWNKFVNDTQDNISLMQIYASIRMCPYI